MAWIEYKAINARDAAQLTTELLQHARDGWEPILLSAGPNSIVVILRHVPGAGQQK
jgi:hypothetical protein